MNVSSRSLLFLCTGNYYRSRFAELFFMAHTRRIGLPWTAYSRGIATERGIANVGPMAAQAIARLHTHNIELEEPIRFPLQLQEHDLQSSDLTIALDEMEHRVLLLERYPAWADQVTYWQVRDAHLMPVDPALDLIEREVSQLVERLAPR